MQKSVPGRKKRVCDRTEGTVRGLYGERKEASRQPRRQEKRDLIGITKQG